MSGENTKVVLGNLFSSRATELVHRRHVSLHEFDPNLMDFSVYCGPSWICAIPGNDC